MKTKYKLIKSMTVEDMENQVNRAVQEGWSLYMGLSATSAIYGGQFLFQWMERYLEDEYETIAASSKLLIEEPKVSA